MQFWYVAEINEGYDLDDSIFFSNGTKPDFELSSRKS